MNDTKNGKERYLVRGKRIGDYVACKIVAKHPLRGGGTTIETYAWMIPAENLQHHEEVINLEDMKAEEVQSILFGGYTDLNKEEQAAVDAISQKVL